MNRAAKGSRIERKARDLLEALGYDVTRAAASMGVFDLIAIHPTHTKLIQVKGGVDPRASGAELEAMSEYRCPANHSRELWLWTDREKYPRVVVL